MSEPRRLDPDAPNETEPASIERRLSSAQERLTLMSHASNELLASSDPEASIRSIAERVALHLNADVFFNYALDGDAGRLRLNACGGVDERVAKMIEHLELGQAICGCVARDGVRVISNDVQRNGDDRAELVRRMGVRSYVCHPLRVGDATVGTLSFGTKRKDSFDDDEIELMRTTAHQISIAMERASVERRLALQSFLLESVGDSVIAFYSEDPDAGRIVYANEPAARDRGYDRGELVGMRLSDLVAPDWRPRLAVRLDKLGRGEDVRDESVHVRKDGSLFPVEVYMTRVDFNGRWLVVDVSRDITQRTADRERLQTALADQSALSDQSLRQAAQLQVLKDLADIGTAATDKVATAYEYARTIAERIDARAVLVSHVDESGGSAVPIGCAGLGSDLPSADRGAACLDGLSAIADAFAAQALVLRSDIAADPALHQAVRESVLAQGYGAVASVPLTTRNVVFGALTIAWGSPRAFSGDEVAFLQSVASEVAMGLQSAHLVESERAELARTRVLQEFAVAAGAALDLRDVVMQMLSAAERRLGLQAGDVRLLSRDGKYLWLLASLGWSEATKEDLREVLVTDSGYMASRVIADGRVLTHEDEVPLTPERTRLLRQAGVLESRYVALPLTYGERKLGIMSLTFSGRRSFTQKELDLFEAMARIMSQAIQNARAYEAEHNIAETLQETLVTLPHRLPGVEFARGYESATLERGRVGGDFVDLFEAGDGQLGIAVGDVSGKGIDAAVVTSLVRNTIRAHAVDGLAPAQVMAKTNRVVLRFTHPDTYVTIFFGLLDTASGVLRYVSAGHPPALVVSGDSLAEQVVALCPLVGAFENAEFVESMVTLHRGDRLVVYTDGVSEARSPRGNTFFGVEGLERSLYRHAGADVERLASAVIRDVLKFSKGVLRDDAALLVVEPTGVSER